MLWKMVRKYCSCQLWCEKLVAAVSYYATSAPQEQTPLPPTWWLHDVESCGVHRALRIGAGSVEWMLFSGVDHSSANSSENKHFFDSSWSTISIIELSTRVVFINPTYLTWQFIIWKRMLSVLTSIALILFQRGARISSVGHSAVGCFEVWTPQGLSAEPTQLWD